MAAPPVGLDITSTALVAVTLRKKGKAYGIAHRAEAPLPAGIVVDGEVHDPEALAAALKAFWAQEGITNANVSIGVANQRCITRIIELPRIKNRKQLREALSFEVADHLPIPLEDTVWDFHTVARWKDDTSGNELERHVVVMVYRESVETYRDALEAAGLKLARIDLAAFALMRAGLPAVQRALQAEGVTDEPVIALLDVGAHSTNIVISRGGICEMNRMLSFGSHHFAQTLVEQFGWGAEDAARVVGEAGILPLGGVETPGDPYADARRVLQYVASQFVEEISTSFDYYVHSDEARVPVGRVVLAGEGALLRGIEDHVAAELRIPVEIMDISPRLDAASVEELGVRQARFGTAFGLAMEEAA